MTPLPEPALTIAQRGLGAAMYTEEQILNYGAAEYRRAIEDAAAEFDRRATLPDGTKLEGFYDPDEPAEIIRKLGKTS